MRVLGIVGAALVITGCGGGGNGGSTGGQAQVAEVSVTPSTTTTSICGTATLNATPRDASGSALNRPVTWTSANTNVVILSPTSGASTTATGISAGSSQITAASGGINSTPVTLAVTGGGATGTASVNATTSNTFTPSCVTITAGGTVTWTFAALHDVDFDGTAPTGGDIAQRSSGSEARTFPTAGQYPYHCNLHPGMVGRVVVQ